MSKKTQQLNPRITPELESQISRLALREKRANTEVARIILEAVVPAVLDRGEALMDFLARSASPAEESRYSSRISRATQESIYTALKLIFDQAPSSVIESVNEFISERAARYHAGDRRMAETAKKRIVG